jgi:tetratricopeptide (TPR) repeat protein
MANPEVQQMHADVVSSVQEMLQGHETFKDALGLDNENILALAVYARELVDNGRLDDAQTLLEGLVVLDPQNPYLHTCLGALYMQKGYAEHAKAEFLYSLSLDDSDIAANTYLGELHVEAAVKYLTRAVELDPESRDPYANRARTLAAMVSTIAREVAEKGEGALEDIRRRAAELQQLGEN